MQYCTRPEKTTYIEAPILKRRFNPSTINGLFIKPTIKCEKCGKQMLLFINDGFQGDGAATYHTFECRCGNFHIASDKITYPPENILPKATKRDRYSGEKFYSKTYLDFIKQK
jgi:hypothetical protein